MTRPKNTPKTYRGSSRRVRLTVSLSPDEGDRFTAVAGTEPRARGRFAREAIMGAVGREERRAAIAATPDPTDCPLCGGPTEWGLRDLTPGATAPARCFATWHYLGPKATCTWAGRVIRLPDGGVRVATPEEFAIDAEPGATRGRRVDAIVRRAQPAKEPT